MRKLLGGLLGFVALICLGLAYTQLARADEESDKKAARGECADELSKKIVELYNQDHRHMLTLQYQLANLRLAQETVGGKNKTVEELISKDEATLSEMKEQKAVKDLNDQLLSLYSQYGKDEDQDTLLARVEETKALLAKGNYRKAKTRFRNRDLSAYVMAHRLIHRDESPYKVEDAAILWLKAEISEGVENAVGRGTAPANTQESSSNIARLAGYVDAAKARTADEIKADIKIAEDALRAEFTSLAETFKDTLSADCAKLATCATCEGADEVRQGAMLTAIQAVGRKLQTDDVLKKKRVDEAIQKMAEAGITVDLKPAKKEKKVAAKEPAKVKVADKKVNVEKNKPKEKEVGVKKTSNPYLNDDENDDDATKVVIKPAVNLVKNDSDVVKKNVVIKPAVNTVKNDSDVVKKDVVIKPPLNLVKNDSLIINKSQDSILTKKFKQQLNISDSSHKSSNPTFNSPVKNPIVQTVIVKTDKKEKKDEVISPLPVYGNDGKSALVDDLDALTVLAPEITALTDGHTVKMGKFYAGDCVVTVYLEKTKAAYKYNVTLYNHVNAKSNPPFPITASDPFHQGLKTISDSMMAIQTDLVKATCGAAANSSTSK